MASNLVQPKEAPAAPVASPAIEAKPDAPAPAEDQGAQLPDEVVQIPAMQALLAGQPAALSASIEEMGQRPEAKAIIANKDPLMQAGIGLYRSLDGATAVMFNQFHIHGEEIKQADEQGQLLEVAPPFDMVNDQVAKSGEGNPVLSAEGPQGGFKEAPAPTTPQAGSTPPVEPAMAKAKPSAAARAKNATPGSPTSGPKPGQGRLLNQILKPVI